MPASATIPKGPPGRIVRLARRVEVLVLDVDGVLTDGRIIYTDSGELLKNFDVKDGHGIVRLREAGIPSVVISARSSRAVERRCAELKVARVVQGVRDKLPALEEILRDLKLPIGGAAAVGDDLPDLPLIEAVGLGVAVADAVPELRRRADWVTRAPGGRGAVREVADLLLAARRNGR